MGFLLPLITLAGAFSFIVMRYVHSRTVRVAVLIPALSVIAITALELRALPQSDTDTNQVTDETTVEIADLTVIVSGTGVIAPARQVPLIFEYAAPVKEVLVKEGQMVKAGDILARLDAPALDATANDARITRDAQQSAYNALIAPPREEDLAAAQAALDAANAAYGASTVTGPSDNDKQIARLQTEIARNQLWQIQLQRDAAKNAASPTIPNVTQADLDNAGVAVTVPPKTLDTVNGAIDQFNAANASQNNINAQQAEAGVTQSDYGVQIADANYQSTLNQGPDMGQLSSANAARIQAQIALNRLKNGPSEMELRQADIDLQRAQLVYQQAQAALDYAILTAPFDGIVAQNNLTVGELPPNNEAALLLVDTSSYYIDLPIDETDIVNVQVGQKVALTLDALPDSTVTGVVSRIALTPVNVGQLVTYTIRVALDPTTAPVRVGMSATAKITVNEVNHVPTLRNRFIRIDRTTQQAYATIRRPDGKFEEVPVVLGLRNETVSEIVSGLSVGQQVVLLPRGTFNPLGGGR